MSKIALMFLGGFPQTIDLVTHWNKLIDTCDQFNEKYVIVVHPMNLNDFILKSNKLFCGQEYYVVDDEHHIKTGWATRSLSDAIYIN